MTNDKVLLTVLRERTSASGTRYLSGFMGKARLIAFLDRDAPEGETHWQLYAQTPDEQRNGHGNGNGGGAQQRARAENGRGDQQAYGQQQHRSAQWGARQAVPPGQLDNSIPF